MFTNHKTYRNTNLRDNQKVFNDGMCHIYSAYERHIEALKGKFFYADESVGIAHYWEAHNSNVEVDMSISIPVNHITIDPQDIVRIKDRWYKIVRIQYKDNKKPSYWNLTLSRSEFNYEVSDEQN